jgi:hypothetical protein
MVFYSIACIGHPRVGLYSLEEMEVAVWGERTKRRTSNVERPTPNIEIGTRNLRSGTTFGVLVFSWCRRMSPLSLRAPATVCQPFWLKKGAEMRERKNSTKTPHVVSYNECQKSTKAAIKDLAVGQTTKVHGKENK